MRTGKLPRCHSAGKEVVGCLREGLWWMSCACSKLCNQHLTWSLLPVQPTSTKKRGTSVHVVPLIWQGACAPGGRSHVV